MYISPDIEPSRKHFFITAIAGMAFGVWLALYESEFSLGTGICLSSFIYFCIGVVVLYSPKIRDMIFGVSSCPWCGKEVITMKDKLKAKTKLGGRQFARCSACNQIVALPMFTVAHFLTLIMVPIAGLFIFQSLASLFLTGWTAVVVYAIYFGRHVNVVKGQT